MTSRVSITLAICLLAAGITVGLLFRSGSEAAVATGHGDHGADAPAQSASGDPNTVEISNFAFSAPAELQAGQTITVTNLDSAPHTFTAVDGSFDTGIIDGGQSITFTLPDITGDIEFFCAVHPSMTGVVSLTS